MKIFYCFFILTIFLDKIKISKKNNNYKKQLSPSKNHLTKGINKIKEEIENLSPINESINIYNNINHIYSTLIPYLSLKNFHNKDMAFHESTKHFFKIIYLYPNFTLGYGVSYNYYDLLNQMGKSSLEKQFIEGFLKRKILDILFNITINTIIRFDDLSSLIPDENTKSYEKNKENYSKYLGLFIDNWLIENFNEEKFFLWINYLQQKYGFNDNIYIYISIINDYDKLQEIYNQTGSQGDLLNHKHNCIFFTLLQSKYDGMLSDIYLFKSTYPSRINYNIFHNNFQNSSMGLYQWAHRWVLSKVYEKHPIKSIDFKSILTLKEKFYKQLSNLDNNIQDIIVLYFFMDYMNPQQKSFYEKYCYWLLCKYYSNHYQLLWQKKFQESQQNKKKS